MGSPEKRGCRYVYAEIIPDESRDGPMNSQQSSRRDRRNRRDGLQGHGGELKKVELN